MNDSLIQQQIRAADHAFKNKMTPQQFFRREKNMDMPTHYMGKAPGLGTSVFSSQVKSQKSHGKHGDTP